MNQKFVCPKCGHDVLIEKGRSYFANLWFDLYLCEKCNNKIVLESKNQKNITKLIEFNTKLLIF